jgi:hypothetical protein
VAGANLERIAVDPRPGEAAEATTARGPCGLGRIVFTTKRIAMSGRREGCIV